MEQAEREALLEELRQKHGEIDPFMYGGQLVVLARPKAHLEWDRYQNVLTAAGAAAATASASTTGAESPEPIDVASATRTFVLSCIVYPSVDEARALFKRYPGAPSDMSKRCTALVKAKIVELGNG